jgi:glycerophosphoryl diester phosphodiesterase
MQEVIDIAKAKSSALGRTLTIYPESKNPILEQRAGHCQRLRQAGAHPFEDALVKIVNDNDMNSATRRSSCRASSPASLKYMRSAGLKSRMVQLVDGNDVNYQTGEMIYKTDDVYNFVDGRPYSWTLAGDGRFFGEMLTPAGLAEIKTYADGIGPWKPQVMAHTIQPFKATNADGTVHRPGRRDQRGAHQPHRRRAQGRA